jgi:hypothetical protein
MVMAMTIPAGRVRARYTDRHLDAVRALWLAYREREATRAALRRAGRLGPRLLADMGIDPEIAGRVTDGWDGLRPNDLLVRSPEGRR